MTTSGCWRTSSGGSWHSTGGLLPDGQHYEGFRLNKEQLLEFVAQDLGPAILAAENPAGP